MKNKVDYFEKVIKVLKDLKKDYPDVDTSKHINLATEEYNGCFLSDKELYTALKKYESELAMNTVSDKDLVQVLWDTDEIFKSGNYIVGVDPYNDEDEEDI